MYLDEILLVKGGCSHQNGGYLTRFGWADEGDLADECVLHCHQYDPEVAVLVPFTGTLGERRVCVEDIMGFSYGCVVRFPRLLAESLGR